MRMTWFIVAAALVVACGQRSPESGRPGQAGTPGGETAQPAGNLPPGVQQPGASSFAQQGGTAPVTEQPGAASLSANLDKPAAAVGQPAEPAPPKPQFKEVTIPSGTTVNLTLETALASDSSNVEETVRAKVAKPIVVDGLTAVPEGTPVVGAVTGVNRSGKVKGLAALSMRFNRLTVWNEAQEIRTASISRQAASTKGKDAAKIGIGAGAGAVIGAVAGGGKGAAIGTAVGGGAGTGVVLATRGEEVRLAVGTPLRTTLQAPLTVRIPIE